MASDSDFSADFKNKTTDDLLVIKHRLLWLLMPTFFILLAVLGLSILTWIQVNDMQEHNKGLQKSIETLHQKLRPADVKPKEEPTTLQRMNVVPFA